LALEKIELREKYEAFSGDYIEKNVMYQKILTSLNVLTLGFFPHVMENLN
jgi:hypothetical protein